MRPSKQKKDQITHEATPAKYFHQMLNMADDDLNPYQYRLLGHYIRVGECWKSVRRTAKDAKISVGMVVKTRNELVDLGYIRVQHRDDDTCLVTVIDRMTENVARYANCSPHEHTVHTVNTPVHDMNQRITQEEEPNKNGTPNGAVRKRDPIYDAIASVWATEASGFIVSLKAMLTAKGGRGAWKSCQLSPPATADEITAYGAWAKANKTGTATTPETIQRWFYEYRAQATKTTSAAAIDTTADDTARARARANALNMFAHMTGGNDESTKP